MKYVYLQNQNPMAMLYGYENGDTLDVVYTGEVLANSYASALDFLFMIHNQDDRPRRKEIRSMSVGDVIGFLEDGQVKAVFAVAKVGFEEIADERLKG